MPRFAKGVLLLGGLCLMILSRPTMAQPGRNDDRAQELARQWNAPPQDSAALAALVFHSARMRDARVHAAVVAAAQNGAAPSQVRLAAIQAMVGHFDPCLFVEFTEGPWPDGGTRYSLWNGAYTYAPRTVQGGTALPGTVREDVLGTVRRISESDPDPAVRQVLALLVQWLTYMKDRPLCSGAP